MKLIFICLVLYIVGLDYLATVNLEFEYTFGCGNSYSAKKRVVMDIVDQLKNRGIPIEYEIKTKKVSGDMNSEHGFNIYQDGNGERKLIVTSNSKSELYNNLLEKYPYRLLKNVASYVSEEDVEKRNRLIEHIERHINFE
jgi:hypothetical protein